MKGVIYKFVFVLMAILPPGLNAQLSDLIISEYGEGSSNNKYMEIFNGTGQDVDLSNYVMWKIINEGNWYERIYFPSGILADGKTFVMVNPSADAELLALADTVGPTDPVFFLFNGNEAFALCKIMGPGDTVIIDVIGTESGDVSPENWDVAGVVGAGAEYTWIRKPTVCGPNANWASSAGTNEENSEWIVIPADHWDDVGKHAHECSVNPGYATDLIISEYGEGSSNNKYMELYNGTGKPVDLSNYVMWKIINDGNWYERAFFPEGMLAHGETFVMVNPDADAELAALRDTVGPVSPTFFLFNGNEAFALCKIMGPGDTVIIDVIGVESGDVSPENWDVAGVVGAGAEHTWIRKPGICSPNANWASSAGTNAENSEWIVIPADHWDDVGKHTQNCAVVSGFASDLIISEYGEGSSNNKYMELYNGTGKDVDLANYVMWKIINDGNWYERAFFPEGILPHGKTFVMVNPDADAELAALRDTVGPVSPTFFLFNGNEAYALCKIMGPGDTVIIDVIGVESGDVVPENWDVAGVIGAGAEHTWIRKPHICDPNSNWASSAGTDSINSEWIVIPADYWEDVGKHTQMCQVMPSDEVAVTFRVDMSQENVSANGVFLVGDFQGFDPTTHQMTDGDMDGVYEITVHLGTNQTYSYRFVNGNEIAGAESVPGECAQNMNRSVDVGDQAITLTAVCFGSCGSCSGTYSVTFRVDMSEQNVSANGIHIIGSFNNFDPAANMMTDGDGDMIYEATFTLNGNTSYQYRFVNGNSFGFEENVPAECATAGNRTIQVENSDIVTEAFCYESCSACSTTSLTDHLLNQSLVITPNPNSGNFELWFDLQQQRTLEIRVFGMTGNILYRREASYPSGMNQIPLSIISRGIYLLQVNGEEGQVSRRIVVH